MTDELIRLARQFVLPVGTHYDGCEADHPVCLLLRMADQFEELLHDRQRLAECERDAMRYRWLRSEQANTDPAYYQFWLSFSAKLCRETRMDDLIDSTMGNKP